MPTKRPPRPSLPPFPTTPWPADAIERRPTHALIPSAKNARWHDDAHIHSIAASITQWGFTISVLIDEADTIIAGHGRVLAAVHLNLPDLPVMVAHAWSDAQKLAYSIADNKLTENGEWNEDLLRIDLRELTDAGFDPTLTGFSENTIETMLAELDNGAEAAADLDDAPPLDRVAVSRLGDLWTLGPHRLLCGDATARADVQRLLAGHKPHLMVTDPPYGVDFDPTWRRGSERRTYMDAKSDYEAGWKAAWQLFPGDVVYIWHSSMRLPEVITTLSEIGFEMRAQLI